MMTNPKDLDEAIRQELIEEASAKPVRGVRQFDYFNHDTGVTDYDKGYELLGGVSLELRHSECMRLQIPPGYTLEDVVEGLEQILEWIKRDAGLITNIAADVTKEKERYALNLGNAARPDDYNPFGDPTPNYSPDNSNDGLDLDVWGVAF